MRIKSWLAVLTILAIVGQGTAGWTAEEDGVALAIVYDTSGSMGESVPDSSGHRSPKYVIANRALAAVAQQIEAFATNSPSGSPRKVQAGLYIFQNQGAHAAIPFGPFDAKAFRSWAAQFSSPAGNTPLGNAVKTAGQAVLDSPLSRKHVLVITDGMSNAGPPPAQTIPGLQQRAKSTQTSLSLHFIAFDVKAGVFAPLKKLGATVVSAADEKQLNTQLDYILQRKILLEDEEPPKRK